MYLFSTGNGTKYFYVSDLKTWIEAQDNCRRSDSILAEPKSPAEYEDIKKLIWNSIYNYGSGLIQPGQWIGATYQTKDGQWVWFDSNQPVGSDGYNHSLETKQPGNEKKNCLGLKFRMLGPKKSVGLAFKWIDYRCQNKFPSICEKN